MCVLFPLDRFNVSFFFFFLGFAFSDGDELDGDFLLCTGIVVLHLALLPTHGVHGNNFAYN